jgi:STE24 endopeptidase
MQITVILAMLLAVLVSETSAEELAAIGLAPVGLKSGPALILLAGTMLVWWSLMRAWANLLLGKMRRAGWYGRNVWRWPGRTDWMCQVLSMALFGFLLTTGGWAGFVGGELKARHLVGLWETALIFPFAIFSILKWDSFYPVNRYMREYIVVGQLAEGMSARPVWSRGEYLSFHVRHHLLIVLIPVFLIFTLRDVLALAGARYYPEFTREDAVVEAATCFGAMVIFVLSPFVLRHIWKTRPLPMGPLRARLENRCSRLRLGAQDILLWDTSGAVANAAVMGVISPVRYILLTDSLVENMRDEHIEAVFGHEAGHVKHHHIFYLVLFVIAGMTLAGLILDAGENAATKWMNALEWGPRCREWIPAVGAVLIFGGWFMLFGFVSRRFERQADVFSALSRQEQPADVTPKQADLMTMTRLSPEAANITAGALERIAMLNGIATEARSWRHSSIASRAAFLRELAGKDGALRDFTRRVKYLKRAILLAAVLAAVGGTWILATQGLKI